MKKNQNPIPKPSFALPMFNRGLKLMALALVSLVAGVGNTNAQTPAIVGRTLVSADGGYNVAYLTQEQYQAVLSRRNTNWEKDPNLDFNVIYRNSEVVTELPFYQGYSAVWRAVSIRDLTITNNGLMVKRPTFVGGKAAGAYYTSPSGVSTMKVRTGIGSHSSTETRYVLQGNGPKLFIDFNELSVNRAMSAAPIGTLKVTPSNNASEQTKVQWSVE
jgi:hypothetical protein